MLQDLVPGKGRIGAEILHPNNANLVPRVSIDVRLEALVVQALSHVLGVGIEDRLRERPLFTASLDLMAVVRTEPLDRLANKANELCSRNQGYHPIGCDFTPIWARIADRSLPHKLAP
jgi:hypothetical protein